MIERLVRCLPCSFKRMGHQIPTIYAQYYDVLPTRLVARLRFCKAPTQNRQKLYQVVQVCVYGRSEAAAFVLSQHHVSNRPHRDLSLPWRDRVTTWRSTSNGPKTASRPAVPPSDREYSP